jgi:hypothetical protein
MDHFTAPRGIILLVISLILVVFLTGTLLAFAPAPAQGVPASSEHPLQQPLIRLAQNNSVPTITLISTFTPLASNASLLTPTPVPSPAQLPHRELPVDMTGVISLGILVVVITLIGTIWGEITDHHKKAAKK